MTTTTGRKLSIALRCSLFMLSAMPSTSLVAQVDTSGWRFTGASPRIVEYQGRQAVLLRDAFAWLPVQLRNGTIEFDAAFTDSAGFNGVQFRVVDADNYEDLYFRPHHSGAADATQYQPVFHGNTGWQLYVGKRYTAALKHRYDAWARYKVVIKEQTAFLFVNDSLAQSIPELLRPSQAGGVVLYSRLAPAWFADVRVTTETPTTPTPLTLMPRPETTPGGAVARWRVSSVFAEGRLAGKDTLERDLIASLEWKEAIASERGFVNLGALHKRPSATENTVLAAIAVQSNRPRTITMPFGFSDRTRVFLNGRLVFTGNDGYRTRDHRFLGTVGFFDELTLSLRQGVNSLTFAVSETSGGWAVGAILADTGLTTRPLPSPR